MFGHHAGAIQLDAVAFVQALLPGYYPIGHYLATSSELPGVQEAISLANGSTVSLTVSLPPTDAEVSLFNISVVQGAPQGKNNLD